MNIKPNDSYIRYTGRWDVTEESATSTANGNYFEFSYQGTCAVLGFDVTNTQVPFPHIYIQVDNGAKVEASLDRFIRISADDGVHIVQVILKGSVEEQNRWNHPLVSKVSLLELEADGFCTLPEDNRPTIEFIGDSITEGISIDENYHHYQNDNDMVYWDDSTASYAWLTAEALHLRPIIMGYGWLGLTRGGAGNIPPAAQAYPYYSDGRPMESANADYIVIAHGTNDRFVQPAEFQTKYYEFLQLVRQRNPQSRLIALSPFGGYLAKEIAQTVQQYNTNEQDSVFFIDSTGWISSEPIHPDREGHKTVAKHLVQLLKERFCME